MFGGMLGDLDLCLVGCWETWANVWWDVGRPGLMFGGLLGDLG